VYKTLTIGQVATDTESDSVHSELQAVLTQTKQLQSVPYFRLN